MTPRKLDWELLKDSWKDPPDCNLIHPGESENEGSHHLRPAGELDLVARQIEDGRTTLEKSRSRVPLAIQRRIQSESPEEPGRVCVVTPGGGHLGGDRLEKNVHCRSGSYLRVEDTGMQRIYGMKPGHYARQTVSITVDPGACLEWIPGPLVPYDGSAFHERIELKLYEDSSLFVPFLMFPGRIAHGERGGYRYYGTRIIARRPGNGDGMDELRFVDSFTAGSVVGHTPDQCLMILYLLVSNEEGRGPLIENLRKKKVEYDSITGGVSLMKDRQTVVVSLGSEHWEHLVEFLENCYVQFRSLMTFSRQPSPFLFTAA